MYSVRLKYSAIHAKVLSVFIVKKDFRLLLLSNLLNAGESNSVQFSGSPLLSLPMRSISPKSVRITIALTVMAIRFVRVGSVFADSIHLEKYRW